MWHFYPVKDLEFTVEVHAPSPARLPSSHTHHAACVRKKKITFFHKWKEMENGEENNEEERRKYK